MKKNYFLLLVFIVSLMIIGCDKNTTVETSTSTIITTFESLAVDLYVGDELYQSFTTSASEEVISLPMYANYGFVFVGWTDGTDVYPREYVPTENIDLTLVQESVSEVFDYGDQVYPDQTEIVISGYTGAAKYLKIPELIEGLPVRAINFFAFEDSDLIEVYIPNSVTDIGYGAFMNSVDLKEVIFYGEAYGIKTSYIAEDKLTEIIDANADICTIGPIVTNGVITYSEGCPVIDAKALDPITIQGEVYYTYKIHMNNQDDLDYYEQTLNTNSFEGCTSLEKVTMPIGNRVEFVNAFKDTPNLLELEFTESSFYQFVNGIVYSKDMETLLYYPTGITDKIFNIPEGVTTISEYAFYAQAYLETIHIPATMENINASAFEAMEVLEAFTVSENNSNYYATDGVLFANHPDINEIGLLKYPQNKLGSTYTIPNNITVLYSYSFSCNKYLEDIDFGTTLSKIYDYVFTNSLKIEVLDFPASVSSIGKYLIFDSHVETIIIRRSSVIDGSITSIATMVCRNTNEDGTMNDYVIYLPDDSFTDYYGNKPWSYMAEHLERFSVYNPETES